MNWKVKAFVQRSVAALPEPLSVPAYTLLQRRFGGLRSVDVDKWLLAASETWDRIQQQGRDPVNGTFVEVGTGRAPIVPVAYWLMGANRTITYDLNRYLDSRVFKASLETLARDSERVSEILGDRVLGTRLDRLCSLVHQSSYCVSNVLDTCGIEYYAPADAGATGLDDGSIDFHTSRTVLEHVPRGELERIFLEAGRVVKRHGLLIHMIDYSDHFSHSDPNISPINFLRFSGPEWDRYADNRFMYMNRMRHDDFLKFFEEIGQEVLREDPKIDRNIYELIASGRFPLAAEFRDKNAETLATRAAWIIARTRVPPGGWVG